LRQGNYPAVSNYNGILLKDKVIFESQTLGDPRLGMQARLPPFTALFGKCEIRMAYPMPVRLP